MAKYRWILSYKAGNNTYTRECVPNWKDDLSKEYSFETGQLFRRAALSGNITFLGADYDWLMAIPFGAKINVELKIQWVVNGSYQNYWNGYFYITDCTVNVDNKSIKVKPSVADRYNAILAGLEKEYDLIKLTPAIQPVHLKRRPMLQIYTAGEEVVSCFLSTMSWEQECESVNNDSDLRDDYHFGQIGQYIEFHFGTNTFIGTKVEHGLDTGQWNDFGDNGTYRMDYFQDATYDFTQWVLTNGLRVYLSGTQTLVWEFSQTTTASLQTGYLEIPDTFTLTAKATGYTDQEVEQLKTAIYGRWCIAADLEGSYAIKSDDIVPYNRNYKYCIPYQGIDVIEMTYNASTTPTEWGVRDDGKYYVKPREDTALNMSFPVARSRWSKASIWYEYSAPQELMESSLRVDTYLRDAFTLEAVIKALLSQIDNTILFDGTQVYSQFLFGSNPVFDGAWGRLVMTPKSNILVAEYTQPARKALITLAEVFKMLKDACGCYWFIDDQNRLRIEHISWFKNGGSYSGTQGIGIDVTALSNPRNGKNLTFGTNEFSYDKIEMPERYEFSWMDDTTDVFKGNPIEVQSGYVEHGKIEEITIGGFNTDIDYMMLNPSTVSEDGMALMCCTVSNGEYSVTINNVNSQITKVQNWQLSMTKLIPNFLISDMPAWNIKVGAQLLTAKGIQRKKQQKINIPIGEVEPNTQLLIKTGVGVGEIQQMAISLTSRMAKTTLRYDTTEQ